MWMSWCQALGMQIGDELLVSYALSLDGLDSIEWVCCQADAFVSTTIREVKRVKE